MADTLIDHLKTLHTHAIDARNGYQEALEDAEGKGMTPLFRDMIALHTRNASELTGLLKAGGVQEDDDGSFMSTVHRTIMSIRSLFNGLDESVVPGLIDGEERNVSAYQNTLALPGIAPATRTLLLEQQKRIQSAITDMKVAAN